MFINELFEARTEEEKDNQFQTYLNRLMGSYLDRQRFDHIPNLTYEEFVEDTAILQKTNDYIKNNDIYIKNHKLKRFIKKIFNQKKHSYMDSFGLY